MYHFGGGMLIMSEAVCVEGSREIYANSLYLLFNFAANLKKLIWKNNVFKNKTMLEQLN